MRVCEGCKQTPESVALPAGTIFKYYFSGEGGNPGRESFWTRGEKADPTNNKLGRTCYYCPKCCDVLGIEWQTLIKS